MKLPMCCLLSMFLFVPLAKADKKFPFSFYSDPDGLTQACKKQLADLQASLDQMIQAEEVTFEHTVIKLERAMAAFHRDANLLTFLAYVSPDEKLREAAKQCEIEAEQTTIDIFANQALFKKIDQVAQSKAYKKLDAVDRRLVDDYRQAFVINGLAVEDPKDRTRIVELKKEITELTSAFAQNIREKVESLWVTKAQLAGMDKAFIDGLTQKDGKYELTTDYPVYIPFVQQATDISTRKALVTLFGQRGGKENIALLEKTLTKRTALAKLLGYQSHAHAVLGLQERIAQSPEEVQTFITDLQVQLKPLLNEDYALMKKLKCKELKCEDESQVKLEHYDLSYYRNEMKKEKANIDMQKIQEYFPLEKVTQGMFDIYQTLLGVSFARIPNPPKWFEGVDLFEVTDRQNKKQLGYFYMDLFPREGKYKHAAAFNLGKPENINGKERTTLSAMVCNFTPPTDKRPSLLTHDEVETYFHEFGHIMHGIVSQTKYASQGGTSVARDFVEAPSQMLENWVWNPEALAKLSAHYKTGKPLPKEELDKLNELRKIAVGYNNSRQLFFAALDMDYHTAVKPVDSLERWKQLQENLMGIPMLENTYPQASFGHLMGGYDAGYYGYMWSKVYAQDMFSRFEKKGILDEKTGMRYRQWILEKGSSMPAGALIQKFLKRKPNNKAFIESLGL